MIRSCDVLCWPRWGTWLPCKSDEKFCSRPPPATTGQGARSCTHGAWEACASHPPIPWGVCSCSGRSAAARLALLSPVAQQTMHELLCLLLRCLSSCLVLSPLSRGFLLCLVLASALAFACFLFSALAVLARRAAIALVLREVLARQRGGSSVQAQAELQLKPCSASMARLAVLCRACGPHTFLSASGALLAKAAMLALCLLSYALVLWSSRRL